MTHLKQSMCAQARDLYSPSASFANPISFSISNPCTVALASTNGKSNESPLYVDTTRGRTSLKCEKKRCRRPRSFGSLKMANWPSYSSLGVYSKSSMSSETTSRFVMRNPCVAQIKMISRATMHSSKRMYSPAHQSCMKSS